MLQREKLRESFRKDRDSVDILSTSMDDTMPLSDAVQRTDSEFAASAASSNGKHLANEQPAAHHEGVAGEASSHSTEQSHVDVDGSVDDVSASVT